MSLSWREFLRQVPATSVRGALVLLVAGAGMWGAGCSKDADPGNPDPPLTGSEPLTQSAPENCGQCHVQHFAEWQRSMHAHAGQDPIWFALNDAGQLDTGGSLGDFCVFCHVPAASMANRVEPLVQGQAPIEVSWGVHCGFCHTVAAHDGISNQEFSFDMAIDGTVYGTIPDPVPTDAHRSELRAELGDSDFCGTCHELVNDHGTAIETTYTEWVASAYTAMGLECQDCHMQRYEGRATPTSPVRTLHRHSFAGVDVTLADVPERSQQIQDVQQLLDGAARLRLSGEASADSVWISARVENLGTGHALPSGPTMERQLWIELTVTDERDAVVFRSGDLDANQDLRDHHSALDPTDDQLAIFNSVLLDEHGAETPFMWRAQSVENRLIPPTGQRTTRFAFERPSTAADSLTVHGRLRFRALPPYVLRELELGHLVEFLPIYDMSEDATTIRFAR